MTDLRDKPKDLRDEDAFDAAALNAWLKSEVDGLGGEPEVKQFSGGASNLTYLLRYPDRELIMRRPPAGQKAKSAHDMGREYRVQKHLAPAFPYVPKMLAHCLDETVIGSEFYVMEKLDGIILRKNLPRGMDLAPTEARSLCESMVDRLVDLHQVDPKAVDLASLGRGTGYVQRQVEGWSKRFRAAKTWNVPGYENVMSWLAERQPADSGACLIHNDYRFDNLVLAADDPQRIIGVLDWEMATIGDPLMDLGGALAYWTEANDDRFLQSLRRQPTHVPGMFTRQEVVEYYLDKQGLTNVDWAFYEVFGMFRVAVILQQIYYRYHHKQTTNPAFKNWWIASNYLYWRCRSAIKKARD
ncbi:phosphotransferase family protein [Pseudonocardiaceae bacterium YIM PH 21723]|nr:phosphotransferase family protein [Pseudonocardiaceae bacterium YIM PH 21723]